MNDAQSTVSRLTATVPAACAGRRLDQVLVELFPDYSRSRLQAWIRAGQVQVDGRVPRARDAVGGGEQVVLEAHAEPCAEWSPEPIPLRVVYTDAALLVIDKPAGLVTHPAVGNWSGTLVNGLLHLAPELAALPRAGIVHRLDKETSGLLVVARTPLAHQRLVDALARRAIRREYLAVVHGVPTGGATIDAPIGRHPSERTRMAVVAGGRPAVTHFVVRERYRANALLDVRLETGRTHQIRVHLAHVRLPLVGDPVYGGRARLPPGASVALRDTLQGFHRQALHATRLVLEHPVDGHELVCEAPLPEDLTGLLDALRRDVTDAG